MADLVIAEAYHVQSVDNIALTQVHTLVVQESKHTHFVDVCNIPIILISTPEPDGATIPILKLTAQAGYRINGDSVGRGPAVTLTEMRAGSRMAGNLPTFSSTATATFERLMSVSGKLPATSCEARTGIRCGASLVTPVMTIEAESNQILITLDKTIQGLEIEATGSTPVLGTLSSKTPILQLSTGVVYGMVGTLSVNIPIPKITATMEWERVGTLSKTTPELQITATGYCNSMELDEYIPIPFLSFMASGGVGGGGGLLQDESRFTDYVLRHAR